MDRNGRAAIEWNIRVNRQVVGLGNPSLHINRKDVNKSRYRQIPDIPGGISYIFGEVTVIVIRPTKTIVHTANHPPWCAGAINSYATVHQSQVVVTNVLVGRCLAQAKIGISNRTGRAGFVIHSGYRDFCAGWAVAVESGADGTGPWPSGGRQ